MTSLCTLTVLCLYVCPVFVGSQLLSASSSSKRVSASASAQPFEVTAVYATTPLNDGSFVTTGENEALPNPYAVVTVYADVSQATAATYALQGFGDPMVSARTKQGGAVTTAAFGGLPQCDAAASTWWTFLSRGPSGAPCLMATCLLRGASRVSVTVAGGIVPTKSTVARAFASTGGVPSVAGWLALNPVTLAGDNPPSDTRWLGVVAASPSMSSSVLPSPTATASRSWTPSRSWSGTGSVTKSGSSTRSGSGSASPSVSESSAWSPTPTRTQSLTRSTSDPPSPSWDPVPSGLLPVQVQVLPLFVHVSQWARVQFQGDDDGHAVDPHWVHVSTTSRGLQPFKDTAFTPGPAYVAGGGPVSVIRASSGIATVMAVQFTQGAPFRPSQVGTCVAAAVVWDGKGPTQDVACALDIVGAYTLQGPAFGLGLPVETLSHVVDPVSLTTPLSGVQFGSQEQVLRPGLTFGNLSVFVQWSGVDGWP